MGQPPGGFPPKVQEANPRATASRSTGRPGRDAAAGRFRRRREEAREAARPRARPTATSSRYLLYPQGLSRSSPRTQQKYSDTSVLPTPVFFYGLEPGEEIAVDIEQGKTLIIKFLTVGEPHADGTRTVFFELNGQPREVTVVDRSLEADDAGRPQGRRRRPQAGRRAACPAWSSPWP